MTNRDTWVYNSSEAALRRNVGAMIDFYNEQVRAFAVTTAGQSATTKQRATRAEAFVNKDPARFSWALADYPRIANGQRYELREDMIRLGLYRPFFQTGHRLRPNPQQQHEPATQSLPHARERERRNQHCW